MASLSDAATIVLINKINVIIPRYVIPVIYAWGHIGNFLSALVFWKKSWRKNVCVFYFNVCLLCTTLYMNSTMIGSILLVGYNIDLINSSAFLCKIYSYFAFLFSTIFPTTLILASIDRLLISSQNVDTRLYSSKRLAYFMTSINTVIFTIYFIHFLIKLNIQEIYPSFYVCYYDPSSSYRQFISYSSAIVNSIFFVVMIVLSIIALKNVRQIRAIPRQNRKQVRSMTKKDLQLLRCLFVQDILYIIFSSPISVYFVYSAAIAGQPQTLLQQTVNNFLSNFTAFLHNIAFCTSFLIFVFTSKAFRHELKRMIYKMIGKEIGQIREEENKQENVEQNKIEMNVVALD